MTKWQVCFDEGEAVFCKPLPERLWHGVSAFGLTFAWAIFAFLHHKNGVTDRAELMSELAVAALILLTFGFGAGPKEMRFNFKRLRYKWRIGFPLLSWTHAGDFSEIKSLSVWNTTKLTGLSVEWKDRERTPIIFVSCPTGREAQALAERLGSKIGVPAQQGIPHGMKSSQGKNIK